MLFVICPVSRGVQNVRTGHISVGSLHYFQIAIDHFLFVRFVARDGDDPSSLGNSEAIQEIR